MCQNLHLVTTKRSHNRRVKRILLTGGTGFIGQFLAIKLLKEGHFLIFLAREKEGVTAEERISSALAFVDIDVYINYRHMYEVVEKIPENIKVDEIYHVAGSTSFAETEREEIFRVNLLWTKNILWIARRAHSSAVHYISTSYVCNSTQSIVYEIPADCYATFQNPYAESKCLAEKSVLKFGEENPICKVFIYRPSIVVGRSWDGLISNFRGFYHYMEPFFRLGNAIIRKNGLKDEIIDLPIWVPGNPKADINIITIDYMIDIMMMIRQKNIPGIYHLTNDSPPTYGWLLEESLRVLNISGPSPLQDPAETSRNLRRFEKGIARGVEKYIAFVTAETRFDVSRVRHVLGSDYYNHPRITSEVVQTLLRFAIQCEFKKEKAFSLTTNIVPGNHFFTAPAVLVA